MFFKAATDVGKKRYGNEDFLFASDKKTGVLPNLFIVADGMGGHNAGEVASELAVEAIVEHLRDCSDMDSKKALKDAINIANKKVYELSCSKPDMSGMGTTLVACAIMDGYALIASIGDSRAYLFSNNVLTQITTDHTVVAEMLKIGSISKLAAKTHPKRHMLTRAIGVGDQIEIDFFEIPLKNNDKILLATDGLTNMVGDDELFGILRGDDSVDTKVSRLLCEAIENGGEDNITFILVDVEE